MMSLKTMMHVIEYANNDAIDVVINDIINDVIGDVIDDV